MRTSTVCFTFSIVAMLCAGMSCQTAVKKPDADPTKSGAKNPVPENIESVKTNAAAAIVAAEKRTAAKEQIAANAAASVDAAHRVNTNQPHGPFTTFVDRELGVALKLLPPPDAVTALEVEKRRSAVLEGRVAEADKLYTKAATEADVAKAEAARLKTEADAAKAKHEAAVAALVAADKKWEAQLKANEASNQAKLDAALKLAADAEEKAKNERHKTIFRALLGLGIACIIAGIALGVVTNGTMLMKSLMLAGAGAGCIGLAQVISHPWFDRIFGTCVGLTVVGGVVYLICERRDAMKRAAFEKQVALMDGIDLEKVPVKRADGTESNLATELSKKMNDPEKAIVKQIRLAHAVKAAKVEAKA